MRLKKMVTRSLVLAGWMVCLPMLAAPALPDHQEFDAALAQVKAMRLRAPEDFDLLYTEAEINLRAARYDAAQALLNEYINVQTQRRRSINDRASNAAATRSLIGSTSCFLILGMRQTVGRGDAARDRGPVKRLSRLASDDSHPAPPSGV